MKKALVIIDMQMMPFIWKNYGGKTLYREDALIANIKSLIEKAQTVNPPVYYVMYTETGEFQGAGTTLVAGTPRNRSAGSGRIDCEIQCRFFL